MTELSVERKHTAYHEAGHAVANSRLGVLQAVATIKPSDGTLGRVVSEGKDHVCDAEDAHKQVLCYCAGYAALIAAGYSNEAAKQGADDDFENIAEIIETWALPGTFDEYQSQSVTLMRNPENIRAVDFVAKALMKHETLNDDYMDVLLERADGNVSEEEWCQFITWRYPGMV
jgi:hypothetical protein